MQRYFKADYEEAGISLWDLPFENVENVDPKLNALIISECEDQRLVYEDKRRIFRLLSRCPEACRDAHFTHCFQFGIKRIIKGWFCIAEFTDPETGQPLPVNIDMIRAWKSRCDAKLKEDSPDAGTARLFRTGKEIKADIDIESDRQLDETIGKMQDRIFVDTRSSKVRPSGLILPGDA
jgi:hypothetical protein